MLHASAGRVQSVALRVLAEREAHIQAFVPQHFWTVSAALTTPSGDTLQVIGGPTAPHRRSFVPWTGVADYSSLRSDRQGQAHRSMLHPALFRSASPNSHS